MRPVDDIANTSYACGEGQRDAPTDDYCAGHYERDLLWLRALGRRSTRAQPPRFALQSKHTLRVWREGREAAAREAREASKAL